MAWVGVPAWDVGHDWMLTSASVMALASFGLVLVAVRIFAMFAQLETQLLHTSHGCACSHGAWWPPPVPRTPLSFRRRHRGCLVHDVRRLRLVVAHVGVGLVDAQRAARERRAVLSEEGGVGGGVGSEG